ncbi:MAG: uL15m family ribosomal protein [Candidatus Pacearchaeota archaeon]
MRVKKRKKSTRMHGRNMGTHGWGARKKRKKSGHRGGSGMSGTGKRNDQKKTLVTKLYGGKYFGKQGITSKGTKPDKRDRINLKDLEERLETFLKKGLAKKTAGGFEINLSKYKILDSSSKYVLKNKLTIKALEASKSAMKKVEEKGGKIVLPSSKEPEKLQKENK